MAEIISFFIVAAFLVIVSKMEAEIPEPHKEGDVF